MSNFGIEKISLSILRAFVQLNIRASLALEHLLPAYLRTDGNQYFLNSILPGALIKNSKIYDVGGGSRPFVQLHQKQNLNLHVIGLDISREELSSAEQGAYDDIIVADLCTFRGRQDGDQIICQSVLEHVPDVSAAIEGLASIVKPGGKVWLFAPSRNALFARLNLLLPENVKRQILFTFFPEKAMGHDGFPAFYNCCTPHEIALIATAHGFEVEQKGTFWVSSYFRAILPAYLLWRLYQFTAWLFVRDNACETFYFVLRKRSHI